MVLAQLRLQSKAGCKRLLRMGAELRLQCKAGCKRLLRMGAARVRKSWSRVRDAPAPLSTVSVLSVHTAYPKPACIWVGHQLPT